LEVVSVNWSSTGSDNTDFTGNNGYGPVSGGTLMNGATTSGVNETLSHNQTGPVWIRYNFVLRDLICGTNDFRSVVVRVRPVLKLQFSFTNPSNFGGEICNGGTVSIGLDALTAQQAFYTAGTDYRVEVVSVNWSTTGSNNTDFTGNNGYGPVSGGMLVNGTTISGVNETLSHNQTGPVWIRYNFVLRDLICGTNDFRSVVVKVLPAKLLDTCPSDATVNTSNNGKGDCTASYAWTHPNIVGCPGGSSVTLQVSVAGNPFTPVTPGGAASAMFGPTGKYEVKYTATDGVNTETCSFFVTVKDDEEPVITTTPGALDRKLSCDDAAGIANAQSLQPSATDNCTASNDLKITPASSIKPGNCSNNYVIERTFQFEDEAGNKSAIYTQIITVEDKEAPVFGQTIPTSVDVLTSQGATCPATPNISLTDNFQLIATGQTTTYSIHGIPFTTPNANASDNCTPSTQIRLFARGRKISRTSGAQGQCTSIYQVDFRLVDECGNTSTASIQYIVKEDSAPKFDVKPQNQSVNVNSFRDIEGLLLTWVQSAGGAQISDNCTSVSVSSKIIGSNVTGNTYCYTYEFTARDLCQNTTADTATFCATVVANAARQQSIVSGTMKTPAVDAPAEVKLYPNPAQHEVNIDLSAFLGRAVNIRIVNTLGQAMQEIRFAEVQAPTERIVLAGYRSGLYLVTIQSADGGIITQKLQIEQR
jgi:hypothetical protein